MTDSMRIEEMRALFQELSAVRYRRSPLYQTIMRAAADDPELLAVLADVDPTKQVHNLLLSGVHYLLLSGVEHPVRAYYRSLHEDPKEPDDQLYPLFRAFVFEHRTAIREIAHTRYVQVNEVGRCRLFLPAFQVISQWIGGQPMAQLELGTSAGLLLQWDQFRYDYGFQQVGPESARLHMTCEPKGDLRPPIPDQFPAVAARLGMDIVPVDLNDADAVLWLRAVVWPDQPERVERLETAIAVSRENPVPVLQGDAYTDVAACVSQLPAEVPLCIFFAGFLAAAREATEQQIAELAQSRPIYVVGIVGRDLLLTDYTAATPTPRNLSTTFDLGESLAWVDAGTAHVSTD